MPRFHFIFVGTIASMLALQTAFASPTPLDDAVMAKRDEYVYDARVAGDDENPPSNVQFPKRQDEMTEVKPRQLAPASISSTDGKYLMGASPCDQDKDISRYFLFSGDLQHNAQQVCESALAGPGADGSPATLPATTAPPYTGDKVIKARVKVAATIYHRGSVRVEAGVANLGMGTDAGSKGEAGALCVDAVNYLGNTCINGITGTVGAGLHPRFQHEATRGGSVTWNDKNGAPQIQFTFSLVPN